MKLSALQKCSPVINTDFTKLLLPPYDTYKSGFIHNPVLHTIAQGVKIYYTNKEDFICKVLLHLHFRQNPKSIRLCKILTCALHCHQ